MNDLSQLRVYTVARLAARGALEAVKNKRLPGDLKNQIERAAISVVSNIAEGSQRESDREFARFLSIARGSVAELIAQLDLGFCSNPELDDRLDHCRRMLNKLINHLTPASG